MVLSMRMFNFALNILHMQSLKRHIAIVSLFIACFVGVTTMVLPHHHHHDGRICLIWGSNMAGEKSHDTGEPLSCNDCPLKMQALQNAQQSTTHGNDRDGILPMMAVLWNSVELPEIDEHGIIPYYIDKEQHCMCVVCTLCGLRAPPAYVA